MKLTRVMVVDNEAFVCDRLRNPLEKVGYQVDTYTDSDRALEALDRGFFDVVVTDLQMAGPTGLDVQESVRNRGLSTQVIIITEYASLEAEKEARAIGASDFITKPFQAKVLTKKVENAAVRARAWIRSARSEV